MTDKIVFTRGVPPPEAFPTRELSECFAAAVENVELAYVDQGYTGEKAAESAAEHGIHLEVVKHKEAKLRPAFGSGEDWNRIVL